MTDLASSDSSVPPLRQENDPIALAGAAVRATPAATAGACGLAWKKRTQSSANHMTWDVVLNLAVEAYWQRRGKRAAA